MVPAQNRVWRDDGRHSREQATAQCVPHFAETSPLTVLETQAPSAEPGLKNAILVAQKRSDLSAHDEATHIRDDDQLKQSNVRSLGDRIDSVVGLRPVSRRSLWYCEARPTYRQRSSAPLPHTESRLDRERMAA
jgi:hypothetical protein